MPAPLRGAWGKNGPMVACRGGLVDHDGKQIGGHWPWPAPRTGLASASFRNSRIPVIALPRVILLGLMSYPPFPAHAAGKAGSATDASSPVTVRADAPEPAAAAAYVGDGACAPCHQDRVNSYHRTAHSMASSLPSAGTIRGKFGPGSNTLTTVNPNLHFVMEANERGYFQTAKTRTSPTVVVSRSERLDVVVGFGRKSQSYLFWDGDLLLELPVSFRTGLDGWVNSPGFVDGKADFGRPVAPRCLECHAGRFESRSPPANRYNASTLVLGISCERCHGPGGEHVARFRSKSPPRSPAESAIVNPARLSRARQLDICGQCHEGPGTSLAPPLSFVPGEDLDRYFAFAKPGPNARMDVQVSRVQLLSRSRCFRSSTTLTCATCHDVHTPQRDLAAFSSACLTCHKTESCLRFPKLGHAIDGKCVECHMPLQQTGQTISRVDGASERPTVRNHLIAVYPEGAAP